MLSRSISSPGTVASGSFRDPAASHAAGESKCQVLPGGKGKGWREPAKTLQAQKEEVAAIKTRSVVVYFPTSPAMQQRPGVKQQLGYILSLTLYLYCVFAASWCLHSTESEHQSLRRQFWHHRSKGKRHEATEI